MSCDEPGTKPITLYRSESTVLKVTVTKDDDGLREDLTSATPIEFQIKALPGGVEPPNPLLSKTLAAGGIVLLTQSGDTKGQFEITIASGDLSTTTTPAGIYFYDVMITMPGSVRHYVIRPSKLTLKDVVNPV
jgi:hypothetical protein